MGQQLQGFYREATELGGIPARTKLSIMTKISSIEASVLEDKPEVVASFAKAMEHIRKEFGKAPESSLNNPLPQSSSSTVQADNRKNLNLLSDFFAQRELYLRNADLLFYRVTELLSQMIHVERASVWLYNADHSAIVCRDLFTKSDAQHTAGAMLEAKMFPRYFATIRTERTLAANNAHIHPGTSEFSEPYLKPLGINSMLDVPIWVKGEMVGVLCHEHVGMPRNWTAEEEQLAYLMANVLATFMEFNQMS
ncbi:GAF domain-containing protein [Rhodoflexus caldus]|uniref:GAF domain-containing protein n=1 Tax=Rhodoflexus caldus TaxID=2891236 RepID=UPI002029D710|nr:GAF domain-containing protein [Rhodoflexus caldus]